MMMDISDEIHYTDMYHHSKHFKSDLIFCTPTFVVQGLKGHALLSNVITYQVASHMNKP